MITVISPAKTLDFESKIHTKDFTIPENIEESEKLIKKLRKLSKKKISTLMNLSDNLSELNYERYQKYVAEHTIDNSKQAAFAFKGDVYLGLDMDSYSKKDLVYAQEHMRILSGFYGILKPLDLIQPYRLEMGTKIGAGRAKNLYQFWGDRLSKHINENNKGKEILINLASNEYSKAIDLKSLKLDVITPHFKENKNGVYKVVMVFAKKARGEMTSFIMKNRIENPEEIKEFNEGGYSFNKGLSTEKDWVFTKG